MAKSHDGAGEQHGRGVPPSHAAPRRPAVPHAGRADGDTAVPSNPRQVGATAKTAQPAGAAKAAQPARAARTAPPAGAARAARPAKAAKPAGRQGRQGRPSGPPRDPGVHGPERAPEPWFRSIRMSGFTVVILGLVMLAVVVLAPSLRILIEQRQSIAALQAALDEKQQSVTELQKDVARWQDPAYIEAQARERLYYVYPGEYSYLVIDDTGTQSSTGDVPISTEIQTTRVDWVKSLLSSLYTAGLTDATPTDLQAPEIGG